SRTNGKWPPAICQWPSPLFHTSVMRLPAVDVDVRPLALYDESIGGNRAVAVRRHFDVFVLGGHRQLHPAGDGLFTLANIAALPQVVFSWRCVDTSAESSFGRVGRGRRRTKPAHPIQHCWLGVCRTDLMRTASAVVGSQRIRKFLESF